MTRAELEHAIRAACDITHDTEVYVFGSQAILGQFPDVAGARGVGMVDIWLRRELPWPSELPMASFSIAELCEMPALLQRTNGIVAC
jgi:hypothetical protein